MVSPRGSRRSSTIRTVRARIALLHYTDGEKRYILAPLGLNVGDTLMSGPEAEVRVGNALPLRADPARVRRSIMSSCSSGAAV